MQFLTIAALAASAFSGLSQAIGVAAVHNKCGKSMYLWSVGETSSEQIHLPDRGVMYNETYRSRADNAGGISIKICDSPQLNDDHTQFEYTVDPAGTPKRMIWYDLSNINGNALNGHDYKLEPSDKDCPTVYCPAGQAKCSAVYNKWNDDLSTHACDANADLVFTLCPDDKDSATGDGAAVTGDAAPVASSEGPASVQSSGSGPLTTSPGPAAKLATAAKSVADKTMKYLHPSFAKRSEHAAAHGHAHGHAHQRVRRSRVFRAEQ